MFAATIPAGCDRRVHALLALRSQPLDPGEFYDEDYELDEFDLEAVAAIVDAVNALRAAREIGRAAFDPSQHLRNPRGVGGGEFRSMGARVADSLKKWVDGGGKGDALEGFTQPQLKSAATQLKLNPPKGARLAELKKLILDAARGHHTNEPNEPAAPKAAKAAKAVPTKRAPRKAAAKAPTVAESTEPKTGVDALPRMKKPPTVGAAAKGTNPHFGTTKGMDQPIYREAGKAGRPWTPEMGPRPFGAYEMNCTNAVLAFEMRMRGYDVQASPLTVLDKHGYADGRTYKETDEQLASSWTLPNGKPHGRSMASQKWRSFDEIDAEIKGWPEGGRGFVSVGKHVFNVTNVNGKAVYVEAQFDATPSRTVTALYKKKYRSSEMFSGGKQEAKLFRLDDLVPANGILDAVTAGSS